METLRIRPAIIGNESLVGYLVRLAERNFCGSTFWLADFLGVKPHEVAYSKGAVEVLAGMTRQTADQLLSKLYDRQDDQIEVHGVRLPVEAVSVGRPRVCPCCLQESGHRRWWWELTPLSACPFHGVDLLSRCQACDKPLSWTVPSVERCRCGAKLSDTVPGRAEPKKVGAARFMLMLMRRETPDQLPSELRALSAEDWFVFLVTLARLNLFAGGQVSQGPTLRRPDRADAFADAVTLVGNWPTSYFQLLDRIRGRLGDEQDGFAAALRPLYVALRTLEDGPVKSVLRSETSAYLVDSGLPVPLALAPAEETFLNRTEAAQTLGVSAKQFHQLLGDPTCPLVRYRKGRRQTVFARSELARLRASFDTVMDKAAFQEALGLTRRQTSAFVKCRFFCKDISAEVSICRARVDQFRRQLHAGLCLGEGAFDLDFVGLRKVANAYGVPLQELLAMLSDHRIRATRHVPAQPGIHGYLFDRITAQKAFDAFLNAHAGGLDKEAAAACLGLRLEELMQLRRMGVIAAAEYGGAKHPRFTLVEIERFKKRFVTKRSLCLDRGRDVEELLKTGLSYADAVAFTVGPRAQPVYRVECLSKRILSSRHASAAE